jgi:TolA-binding protein
VLKLALEKSYFIITSIIVCCGIFLPSSVQAEGIQSFLSDVSVIETKCPSLEDYAREYELKRLNLEKETDNKLKARGYFYLAVLRFSQMQAFKGKEGLDYARKYVSLSSLYYNQALEYITLSLSLDPLQNEAPLYLLKLLIYNELHNPDAAGIEFSRLSKSIEDIDNESAQLKVYQEASKILYQYNANAHALSLYEDYFNSLVQSNSSDASSGLLSAADQLFKENSYSEAYQLYQKYLDSIKDENNKRQKTLAIADKFFEAESYRQAILLYESLAALSVEASECLLFKKARSYDKLNQTDKAITLYQEIIEGYPDSDYYIGSLKALEDNFLEKNNFCSLSQVYEKLVIICNDKNYEREEAFYHWAHALFMDKNYKESKEVFLNFISEYPDSSYSQASHKYLERIDKILGKENFINED